MNYQDKWLRLVAYPVLAFIIRHFGDMTPWGQLLKQPLYYADLVWDLLIVFTSWESNRRLIMYLDKHYSWVTQKFQRFVIQFFTALPMTFIIVIPMIYLWNEVIIDRGGFDTANLLVNDVPLIIIFTSMVHMIYTFMYYHQHYSQTIEGLEARIKELETSVAGVSKASDLLRPSGFEDAWILAEEIQKHPHALSSAFKSFETRRVDRVNFIVNTSYRLGRVAQLENQVMAGLRNFIFRLLLASINDKQMKQVLDIA
jgi:hypothetical protein